MKLQTAYNRKHSAFTLIEMIGVLAVIAILAALLLPKVFEAINSSRVNNAAVSYNTVKAALTDHYAKYGSILSSNGVSISATDPGATNYDSILLAEGFLDKAFQVKIGDNVTTRVEVVPGAASGTTAAVDNNAYDLDGAGADPKNDAGPLNAAVVQAVISGATESDAKDLNDRIDGVKLGSGIGTNDITGRVKYAKGTPTTVYIYVTHR